MTMFSLTLVNPAGIGPTNNTTIGGLREIEHTPMDENKRLRSTDDV